MQPSNGEERCPKRHCVFSKSTYDEMETFRVKGPGYFHKYQREVAERVGAARVLAIADLYTTR
jgi:hypothetical protein